MKRPIRVAIADDHPIVRAGLRGILSSDPGIEVVGEAEDGVGAVALVRKGGIDVMMLDLAMPGRAGLTLLRQVLDEAADLRVVVFTTYVAGSHRDRAMAIGASAYLAKDARPNEILAAITQAMVRPVQRRLDAESGPPHTDLSIRQYDVLMRLVRGESVTGIANDLHLSVKTVSTHKITIQKRLGAKSVVDLVRYAVEHGLVSASG
ncbi:MAG: response regulator transcription factor [Burkholderiales bacterium]|nr:response regulator transcription factor [Burkholderiales bacterium]